jgi:hypothetical protein
MLPATAETPYCKCVKILLLQSCWLCLPDVTALCLEGAAPLSCGPFSGRTFFPNNRPFVHIVCLWGQSWEAEIRKVVFSSPCFVGRFVNDDFFYDSQVVSQAIRIARSFPGFSSHFHHVGAALVFTYWLLSLHAFR